jgi:hypothetical protein
VLELLGIKYIILFRHPIDQMAASCCDALNPKVQKEVNGDDSLVKDHIYPYPGHLFRKSTQLEEGLKLLIREGYLTNVLTWMTDWLHFRNMEKSLIVRYEDFVSRQHEVINDISRFLIMKDADEACLNKCAAVAEKYARKRSSASLSDRYPHGWTGKIGVWKDYFSDENKNLYLSMVNGFLAYYPHAASLLEVYPDLLNVASSEKPQLIIEKCTRHLSAKSNSLLGQLEGSARSASRDLDLAGRSVPDAARAKLCTRFGPTQTG